MATDYKALGKRISNARKQAGITQEALGEQLNMTRKHISVIESAIKRPSLDACSAFLSYIGSALPSSSTAVSSSRSLPTALSMLLSESVPRFFRL